MRHLIALVELALADARAAPSEAQPSRPRETSPASRDVLDSALRWRRLSRVSAVVGVMGLAAARFTLLCGG